MWEKIAESLNGLSSPSLNVGKRAVCDHVGILINRYKRRIKAEEKASGISPGEPTELDNMLEEIMTLEETAEVEEHQASYEKRGKMDKDRAKAEDMRLEAMETLSETKKRTSDDMDGKNDRRKRRSGNEAFVYLSEKAEKDRESKQEELKLKKEQQELEGKRLDATMKQQMQFQQQQAEMIKIMQQQQQQQQQQLMNFQMLMMQQQQEQTKALVSVLRKMEEK